MKILAAHDGAGCGFYRMSLPLEQMAKHGHEVTYAQQGRGEVAGSLSDGDKYDVIVGQRLTAYDGLSAWRMARKPSNRLVYENDDDLFNLNPENWAAYQTFGRLDIREAIRAFCESSDLITVTTGILAEAFAEEVGHNAWIDVLPNFIPELALELPRAQNARPRVGWVGAASHARDVHVASKAVRRFLQRQPGWDLYLAGTDYRPSFAARNWKQMIYGGWTQVNEDRAGFYKSFDFDIGICPVLDNRFSRSKSYLKPLEMNARGIPVVASDIAPYREYIRQGENGFLVNAEHEWLSCLSMLASDDELRFKMSQRSREIAAGYTIEGNWQLWEEAYGSLFGGSR